MAKKILGVKVNGFRRISEAHFKVGSNVVEITGPNGAGKSSIMLAIESVLGRPSSAGDKPIKEGWTEASATLEVGGDRVEILFKRTFYTDDEGKPGNKLEAFLPTGGRARGEATKLLRAMTGGLVLDPTPFLTANRQAQVEQLAKFIPGFDFKDAFAKRTAAFAMRTDIGRDMKRQESALSTAEERLPPIPKGLRSVDDIMADIGKVDSHNARVSGEEQDRERLVMLRDQRLERQRMCLARVEEMRVQIASITGQMDDTLSSAKGHEVQADALSGQIMMTPEPPDRLSADDLKAELATARGSDEVRIQHQQFEALKDGFIDVSDEYKQADENLAGMDKSIRDALALAEFPLPGLSFSAEGEGLWEGEPLEQASLGQRVVIALALFAALRRREAGPDALMTMILPDVGPALSESSMEMVAGVCDRFGVDVLIERVSEPDAPVDQAAIVILDGHVVDVPAAARKPARRKGSQS